MQKAKKLKQEEKKIILSYAQLKLKANRLNKELDTIGSCLKFKNACELSRKMTLEKLNKFKVIDVESIPRVPGASRRTPRALWHRKMMKVQFFNKIIKKSI